VGDDVLSFPAIRLRDFDLARQDERQSQTCLAETCDGVSGAEIAALSEPGKPVELIIRKAREHLRPACRDKLVLTVGHTVA
jgi:hypothetical protein